MTKSPAPKSKSTTKRRTRAELDERLSIPLAPLGSGDTSLTAFPEPKPVDAAARQRIRDRAGD